MSLPKFAVENRALVHFVEVPLVVAGIAAYLSLGKLEDPDFSIKRAVIITPYPGASPAEVELEVTDRIEKALQEMTQLDRIYSESRAGVSIIRVDIQARYWSPELPQIWDEMRKKIGDIRSHFPPGVGEPDIGDDYGFVYGFLLAVTGDGFEAAQLEEYAKFLKKDLSLVPGVSRVELWGNLDKVIYVDTTETQIAQLGLTAHSFVNTIGDQNMVVDGGHVNVAEHRLRVAPSGEFTRPDQIGDLALRPTLMELVSSLTGSQRATGAEGTPRPQAGRRARTSSDDDASELIRIRDVGTVTRGYLDPPRWLMRYDGQPSIAIYMANEAGGNILATGESLDRRLAELEELLPVGLELHKLSWQSTFVEEGIDDFMEALFEALVLVLGIVTLALGWRLGVVVGSGLLLSVAGVFIFMSIMGIDLHRMSLGALIIALGMIVDDIIVVSDLYLVKLSKGIEPTQAAVEAAEENASPLLWATTAAAFAFFPIFLSPEGAGEFCRSLFQVVGASLWISWIFAMTLTPVRCIIFMPKPPRSAVEAAGEPGRAKQALRRILEVGIAHRFPALGTALAVLVVAIMGFGEVKKQFFPKAARTQILIDYWGPQGTRIENTSAAIEPIERKLLDLEDVANVSSYIGQGAPRFYLPIDGQWPTKEYAQILVNTHEPEGVDRLVAELGPWLEDNVPDAMVRLRRLGIGPSDTWEFEVRLMGPNEADLTVLRELGNDAVAIVRESPLATDVRIDMRQRVKRIVPEYNQERGRLAGLTRPDVGDATRRLRDGIQVGLYREGDDLYPILVRNIEEEREEAVSRLPTLQVRSDFATEPIPLAQVTDGFEPAWEDPIITRYDRRRQVAVQGSPVDGATLPMLRASVMEELNELKVPRGYQVLWDGQHRSSVRAQRSLVPGTIPAFAIMVTILIYLFNAYRPPLVILLTLPFAMIGITAGLLVFDKAFGFVAILGVLSLSGIMLRNAVVLLETIDHDVAAGQTRYEAVINAALSRARPVMICALATGLGLIPLFPDVFWGAMSAAMIFGILVGTVLTLLLAPVLYATLYRLHAPGPEATPPPTPSSEPL